MDQELKQRLIGAVVVTALAAIFIPMLFDDPVDQSGQVVSELVIPEAPVKASEDAANKLPANAGEVLAQPDLGLTPEETEAIVTDAFFQQDSEAEYMDTDTEPEGELDESEEAPVVDEPVIKLPKSAPKQESVARVTPRTKPSPKQERVVKVKEPVAAPPKPVSSKVAEIVKQPPKITASADKALPAKAKPAPSLSRWYIQVGSYSKEANAMAMWNNLRKQGFPVLMETIHLPEKGTLYRLKVGPELDQKRAAAMKEKLDKQNNLKTILRAE